MHLTDTPSQIYPNIRRLIDAIKPNVILHTGDVCDDVKLELYPNQIDLYEKKIQHLASMVSQTPYAQWHITPGNHDDIGLLRKVFKKAHIHEDYGILHMPFGKVGFSHYHHNLMDFDLSVRCFGHDLSVESVLPALLNGLEAIYVIQTHPFKIYSIPYPFWTDDYRKKTMKMGF